MSVLGDDAGRAVLALEGVRGDATVGLQLPLRALHGLDDHSGVATKAMDPTGAFEHEQMTLNPQRLYLHYLYTSIHIGGFGGWAHTRGV